MSDKCLCVLILSTNSLKPISYSLSKLKMMDCGWINCVTCLLTETDIFRINFLVDKTKTSEWKTVYHGIQTTLNVPIVFVSSLYETTLPDILELMAV